MLLHASLRWQMRFSNVSIAFFHDACEALSEAGRVRILTSENDIRCVASIKREGINFFKPAWKIDTFSFLRPLSGLCHFQLETTIRPASLAEHASIKEKMRKHLRKSAFVSDEQAITLRG